MNSDEILEKILNSANYPKEKRAEFIEAFYRYLFARQLTAIEEVDQAAFQKITAAMQTKAPAEEMKKLQEELSANPKIKDRIDKISNEVIGELVDDIASSATIEQKQQIFASLPS